jgi:SAM-dependent methyltransferase
MHFWHDQLAANKSLRFVETFNHGYAVRHAPKQFSRTLEIGAGLGEHLEYEALSVQQRKNYYALELRQNMAQRLRERHPDINTIVGDCQTALGFENGYFDRIIAVHVLEHLPDLPKAAQEMHRLCARDGVLSIVIPCEGGLLYSLGRKISAQRIFERRYKQPYDWFIEREHINVPAEIMHVLQKFFTVSNIEYFPFAVPTVQLNICIGVTMRPKRPDDVKALCL